MHARPCPGLVVVSTDTGAGKTFVAAAILRHLNAQGWNVAPFKPLESGFLAHASDAQTLIDAACRAHPMHEVCPWPLPRPVTPAAEVERTRCVVSEALIIEAARRVSRDDDAMIVESAGGVLSPITADLDAIDLARVLCLPALLVVPDQLGAINLARLAIEAIQRRDVPIQGVILNQRPSAQEPVESAAWIRRRVGDDVVVEQWNPHARPVPALIDAWAELHLPRR